MPPRSRSAILYIRRQGEYLISSWQQWYSKGESDLNAWLVKALAQFGHWDQVTEDWAQHIGAQNVIPRVFQRTDFVDGDLLADFCAVAGIDMQGLSIPDSQANVSYSDAITDLATQDSGLFSGPHDLEFSHFAGSVLSGREGPDQKISLISQETREAIGYFYRKGNEQVCRQFFPGRQRLFDPIDHTKYAYLAKSDLVQIQLKLMLKMIFELSRRKG